MRTGSNSGHPCHLVFGALAVALALLTLSSSALAQRERRAVAPQWRGDIGRFHEHDWGLWRGGHWARTRHDGRLGWWWVVGTNWYFTFIQRPARSPAPWSATV